MVEFKLHDSLSGKKVAFAPVDENHVRIYACGPTVYNYAHIGNARMAVVFDLLSCVMRRLYPKVTYVSNITDVEDKIIVASREMGEPIDVITRKFEQIYNDDMAALGVDKPDIQPRATETIPEMIAQIELLIQKGHAYENEGHVLFNVPSFNNYGGLSRRSRDEQVAGARVEVAPYKKDAADFVLWKPSKDDEPGWDSPWGRGRPGWHIECSAMSEKHLGLPFDIHGGGADLKFPHHENELAQSCCAYDHKDDLSGFSKYWMHNGFVTVQGEKMSKSIGNIRLVHEMLKNQRGEVLRLALLSAHYRQPLDWSESVIKQSEQMLDGLYRVLFDLQDVEVSEDDIVVPDEIITALCDDLNTPKALAALSGLRSGTDDQVTIKARILGAGRLLGLLQDDPAAWLGFGQSSDDIDESEIEALLADRQSAKTEKNYARADEIRDVLLSKNIVIEDTAEGTKWRLVH